ncbi:MAG TPA: TonB family protein [Ignavibacteriaceae bacterium]|nr:TonB family protein [Ignavibacteriaceae bacterium]
MMKCNIYLLSLFLVYSAYPQEKIDTSYYQDGKIKSVVTLKNNVREGEAKFYFENGLIEEESNYVNGKVNGLVKIYNQNGKLSETVNVQDGKREGPTSLFDSAGTYLTDLNYQDGKRVIGTDPWETLSENRSKVVVKKVRKLVKRESETQGKNTSAPIPPVAEDENIAEAPLYYINPEVMPEPAGGMESIYKRLRYPAIAQQKGIEGTVKVSALIDQYGEVKNAVVVEGIGYGCDEAARLTVFYTKFKPGLQKGKPVTVQMVIPVEFRLPKQESN